MNNLSWKKVAISDICISAATNIQLNKIKGQSGDYSVYGASGYIQNIDYYQQDSEYLGIVKDGSGVGRVNIYPAYSSLLSTMQYILPKECCNIRFLMYVLRSLNLSSFSRGAAIPHIYYKDYCKINVFLPSIEEQEQIVFELDKIQAALDNKKEQLKKLDELIQSKFYEMFGDLKGEPIELNKVIDVVSGLVNPNVEPYCSQYHIGPGNIVSDTGEIIDCKLAKDEGLISNKYAFKKGMVLYSKISPNLNKVAIPKFDGICSADMYPLILKESVVDAFIWKLLSSQDFLVYAIKHSGRARMPKLNRETLLAYKFILPPLPLQQAFAAYVEKVEQAKAIVNQEIAHLQELLNSRMDFYFHTKTEM